MKDVLLLFKGTKNSATDGKRVMVAKNDFGEISLKFISHNQNIENEISLDFITAVKLHKELKRQIGILSEEREVRYGR